MDFLDYPLEIKSLSDDGAFAGYASVFNVTDQQGDVVRRGAFADITRNADGRVPVLWQHDPRAPIATASVREDDHGLAFDGRLILEDPQARIAQAHMRAKSVRGMSIGFSILSSRPMNNGRELTSLRLHEISVVTLPANPQARVTVVKALTECTDLRELKNLLHDRDRLSRRKASAAADALWRIMQGAEDDTTADDFAQALKSFCASLKGN